MSRTLVMLALAWAGFAGCSGEAHAASRTDAAPLVGGWVPVPGWTHTEYGWDNSAAVSRACRWQAEGAAEEVYGESESLESYASVYTDTYFLCLVGQLDDLHGAE